MLNEMLIKGKNIKILSSYHVGSRIWNHNAQFVTLKKLQRNFEKSYQTGESFFYNRKKALTGF
jgi:hypothetical protein